MSSISRPESSASSVMSDLIFMIQRPSSIVPPTRHSRRPAVINNYDPIPLQSVGKKRIFVKYIPPEVHRPKDKQQDQWQSKRQLNERLPLFAYSYSSCIKCFHCFIVNPFSSPYCQVSRMTRYYFCDDISQCVTPFIRESFFWILALNKFVNLFYIDLSFFSTNNLYNVTDWFH